MSNEEINPEVFQIIQSVLGDLNEEDTKILIESFLLSIFFVLNISFPIKLIDQKRNIIVRELEKTDIIFTA